MLAQAKAEGVPARAHPHPARRPRRRRDLGARLRRAVRGVPRRACAAAGLRRRDRLRRRSHDDHHGPLRGRLVDGRSAAGRSTCTARAGSSPPRTRRSRPIRSEAEGHRPGPARRSSIAARRQARRPDRRRRRRGLLQLPRRPRHRDLARLRRGRRSTKFDRGPQPNVNYAGMMQYDGDTKLPPRFLVAPPAIDRTLGEYLAKTGVAPVRDQRDAEVRPRHLLLERQPLRQVRRGARDLRRDPDRRRALRAAAVDEVRRDHRHADRRRSGAASTASCASTTPTATWSATPATSRPR